MKNNKISLNCRNCGVALLIPSVSKNKRIRCPRCKIIFRICDKCRMQMQLGDRFCEACGKEKQRSNKTESSELIKICQNTLGKTERPKGDEKMMKQFQSLPKTIRIGVISAIIILPLLFGWFVWPTPWKTYRVGSSGNYGIMKLNRITGSVCTIFPRSGYQKMHGDCWTTKDRR